MMKSIVRLVTRKAWNGNILSAPQTDTKQNIGRLWIRSNHTRSAHRVSPKTTTWCIVAGASVSALISTAMVCAAEHVHMSQHIRVLSKEEKDKVIKEADVLYSQNQIDDLYDFVRGYEDVNDAQICWRLARAACNKAKHCDPKSMPKERQALMQEGFKHAERSIQFDDKCGACHRWYAVMLNYVGDYEGNTEKIKHSYVIKEHFQKAIELNPKDATAMYCLGQWCYYFADMSWYTKKIAALIFASPPSATFQEALDYFCRAEKTDPNFYSMNHLMLARTYLKINNKTLARDHLIRARDLPVKSPDDRQAHAESIELLNQL